MLLRAWPPAGTSFTFSFLYSLTTIWLQIKRNIFNVTLYSFNITAFFSFTNKQIWLPINLNIFNVIHHAFHIIAFFRHLIHLLCHIIHLLWSHMGAGIACWLQHQTHDRKIASSNPSRSSRRIFFSRVNFVCWLLFGVRSAPMLLH